MPIGTFPDDETQCRSLTHLTGTIVPLKLVTESQSRPLAGFPLDQQLIIGQRAIDTGREDMVTAAEIVYEGGMALMKIRDKKYYRDVLPFETFESCKERWDFSSQHACRFIDSAKVV